MRNKQKTVSLFVSFSLAVVGCQSTSQLAWWKSAKNSELESTAIAHSAAPQLPSEAVKQAEQLAASGIKVPTLPAPPKTENTSAANVASMVATQAQPSATQASYPTTGAAGYPAVAVANVPSSYPTTQVPAASTKIAPSAASQASTMAMPYDPGAVPPPKSNAEMQVAATTNSAPRTDRYAVSSMASSNAQADAPKPGTPAYQPAPAYQSGTPAYQAANSRYGAPVASSTESKPNTGSLSVPHDSHAMAPAHAQVAQTLSPAANASSNATAGAGTPYPTTTNDRHVTTAQPGYGRVANPSTPTTNAIPATGAVAEVPYPTTTGSIPAGMIAPSGAKISPSLSAQLPIGAGMVANGNYRPGGTSNYPGTAVFPAPTQVASRPDGTMGTTLPGESVGTAQQPPTQSASEPMNTRYR